VTRFRLTPEDRAARLKARHKIVQAANRYAVGATPLRRAGYTMRQLQQAVAVVRRHNLVTDGTLALAGFNAKAGPR
jgi:hypothetical protein